MLQRVEQDEQLQNVLGQRRTGGLHDEHVLLADIFVDLDLEVLVGETSGVRSSERNTELTADFLRQRGVRGAGKERGLEGRVALVARFLTGNDCIMFSPRQLTSPRDRSGERQQRRR